MKILVIKRDKIGDLLLTTPLLAHLRAALPQARIDVLVNDYNAWVIADEPAVDRRWIYRRVREGRTVHPGAALGVLWQNLQLRREHYDVALVANGSYSARALARAIAVRAARTIAYVPAGVSDADRGLTDPLPEPDPMHERDRLLGLAVPLGVAMPAVAPDPCYRLPERDRQAAGAWLAGRGLAPGGYAVIGLGARRAKKQPSTAQVLRWAQRLKDGHGLDTVFMWTPGAADDPRYPGDDAVAEPVLAAGLTCLHPFRGPIPPALGLIWQARASVFPDSGLMHFAAASPGGVLGLFADTTVSPSPAQWGPCGPRSTFLEAAHSVAELSDESVFAALAGALSSTDPSKRFP